MGERGVDDARYRVRRCDRNLATVAAFCRKMGRDANQGEIGMVIADQYFAIRDYRESDHE